MSLLERLHTLYDKKENTSHLCFTLLTNYRCHPALLALPSYLFYESALINSTLEEQSILHPNCNSFPLHFICSSLDTSLDEVTGSTNSKEAGLLLDEAAKYLTDWPDDWNDKHKQVCIMSTTANQVCIIMIRSRLDHELFYFFY